MPRKPTRVKPNPVRQLVSHVLKNGLTTMLGLSTGVPLMLDGYSRKDWSTLGSGVSTVLLGLSGQDKFGMGSGPPPESPRQPPPPPQPPYV
ncbi:hypothetical protein [Fibrella aquatilis]|uniref:Uncharacterized protein n=1 Tax=Fibrella aquatilis TaxID=2817059 RepID=A0A939JZN4_9BACT|nr:hypothetical protein [Fibrella aquatilis]MBO0930370.1 hypothetical protein [Fibrella aquatilis]